MNETVNHLLYITSFSKVSGVIENDYDGKVLVLNSEPKKIKTGYRTIDLTPRLIEDFRLGSTLLYELSGVAPQAKALTVQLAKRGNDIVLIYVDNSKVVVQGISIDMEQVGIYHSLYGSAHKYFSSFISRTKKPPIIVDSFQVATN